MSKDNKFTLVTDVQLLVSGSGAKPVAGTKLSLKLSVNADGTTKYRDTDTADGRKIIGNKVLFSNEYKTFSVYSFVTIEYFNEHLADLLMQDESGVKYIQLSVVVPTFTPAGSSKPAAL